MTRRRKYGILLTVLALVGLQLLIDDISCTSLGHRNLPGLRLPFPYEDEKDREIMLEMQRRFDLERGN